MNYIHIPCKSLLKRLSLKNNQLKGKIVLNIQNNNKLMLLDLSDNQEIKEIVSLELTLKNLDIISDHQVYKKTKNTIKSDNPTSSESLKNILNGLKSNKSSTKLL